MIRQRFHCKTRNIGITITLGVVVMLLLFSTSCGKEVKEVVVVAFDAEHTYTMKTTDVSSLISDSGIIRYRINTKAWLVFGKASDPYSYFPEGLYVEKFDTLFQVVGSVKADTAYYYDNKGLLELIGNVEVETLQGERIETSRLFWDQRKEKVHSNEYVRIEQADKIVTGIGFESNQDMTQYTIFNSQGVFPIKETPADSTQVMPADSVGRDAPNVDPLNNK